MSITCSLLVNVQEKAGRKQGSLLLEEMKRRAKAREQARKEEKLPDKPGSSGGSGKPGKKLSGGPQEKMKNIKEVMQMWQGKDRNAVENQEHGVLADTGSGASARQAHGRLDRPEKRGVDEVCVTLDLGDKPNGVDIENLTFTNNFVKTLPVKRKGQDLEVEGNQGTPNKKQRNTPLAARRRANSEKSDNIKFKNLITNHFRSLSPAVLTGDGGPVQGAGVQGGGVRDVAVPKAHAKTNCVLARVGEVGKTGCTVTSILVSQTQAAVGNASRQQLRENCTVGKVGKKCNM